MKVLMVYPNLPMMYSPPISVALFNAICKEEGVEFRLFETTEYTDVVDSRYIRMSNNGGTREAGFRGDRDEEYFSIKPEDRIIPDFVELVGDYDPDLILMSMQEDVFDIGINLLDSIKDKTIPHILGGIFAISAPEYLINDPLVNIICRYEGEEVVRQAIRAMQSGGPLNGIEGIWWKDECGTVHKNKPAPLTDITKTMPDFTCFEHRRLQRPVGGRLWSRAISMETYRGCPYKCTYCNSPATRQIATTLGVGNYLRRKPPSVVEHEFQTRIDQGQDPDFCMFFDDSFLARPAKEIYEFCEMWSKHRTPFWFNTRIENCKPSYLDALKHAGVYRMAFGLEAGNEDYRKNVLKRTITNKVYEEYFTHINDSNIPYSLNVIIGMPYETRELVMDTARAVHAIGGYDSLAVLMFRPYKGTELCTVAENAGFLEPNLPPIKSGLAATEAYQLNMPPPYLQADDVRRLIKTFPLYAYYPEEMWDTIYRAETDDQLYDKLIAQYKKQFFHDEFQTGGADRAKQLGTYCMKHDPSTSYNFEAVSK